MCLHFWLQWCSFIQHWYPDVVGDLLCGGLPLQRRRSPVVHVQYGLHKFACVQHRVPDMDGLLFTGCMSHERRRGSVVCVQHWLYKHHCLVGYSLDRRLRCGIVPGECGWGTVVHL